jgi:predicted ester cyclase
MSEHGKALMQRWFASVADGTFREAAPEIWHPKFDYRVNPDYSGVDGMVAWVEFINTAFRDQRPSVLRQVSEGDWVCTLFEVTATQRGEFLGVPASGNEIKIPVLSLARVEDGKFIEEWELFDGEELRRQMAAEG